jgi:tetratricopeptide (TPR) repeat protein
VAVFAERDLNDVERAIDAHRRVVALAPEAHALDALARLYASRGEHAAAARWLEKRLESAPSGERVAVALRLARAHVAARQPGRAITWLERTLPRHPEANEVRSMLADLYRDADAWAPLAKLLCDGCRYAPDQAALLAMVREAAALYHERLATPERAVPLLEQARELVPDDRWVRLTLADGLRMVGRYAEARKLLEGVIADYGRRRSPERADVHLELARVLRADGKLNEALAQLDLAAGMKVGDTAVMATLGAVAREAGQLDRAEQAYRALLLVVRRAQGDADPSAIGPSEVLFALSRIAVGQGNAAQAEELRQQALAAAAADSAEARRFSRAAQVEGEGELAVSALEARRAVETSAPARAALDAALGALYEDALDKPEEALAADLRALEGLAPDRALHARTRALARRLDQSAQYLARLEELAERHRRAEEAPLVSELLLRLGEALEEDAGELARAAETFARVEALGHHPVEAKKALARVAGMRGVSGDERRRLEEIVALAGAPEDAKVDALYRLADIDVAGPENRARGIAALEDALERDPQYARAATSLRDAADGAPDDADIWALFERVARVSGDDALLADYLERRARHPAVTLDELREAVTLAAQRGEAARERALLERTVDRARELPGGLGEALWAAEALAERRHAAGDDAGAIRWLREAAGVAEPAAAEALTMRAAQLAASDEATMDLAVELYRELCERRPAERTFWAPLLEILRRRGDAESAGALVAAVAAAEADPGARNALRIDHARWLVETADGKRDPRRAEAASLLRDVLDQQHREQPGDQQHGEEPGDAEPENAEVIAVLGDLYQQSGDSDALLDLLRRQIESARRRRDAPALVALSLRAAEVMRSERPDDARALLREAVEWAPSDRTLLSRLLELLRGDDEARERAERMEQLLAVERGTAAAKLARDLADTWDKLGDEGGVRRALEVGYRAAPADEDLRRRLERHYRERKSWPALAALLVSEAARRDKAPDAVALFREAALIHRERLSDAAGAASALRSALALAPADVALVRELIAVHEATGDAGAAAQDIQSALRSLPKGDARALELHKLRAELLEELGREADAVADFERAFSLGGVSEAPRLVAALQRWRDRAGRGGDLAAERAATMRLVEVLVAAKDEDGARDALVGWIAADPTDREALRALRGMDEVAGRWSEVAESCQRLVALSRGAERIDAAVRLAEACVRAGDPAAARAGLEQAWAADPSPTLRQELKKLYEQIGAHGEHAQMLLAEAEATESDAARYPLLIAAGELLLHAAEEPAEALGPLRAALAIKPDDPEANILLVDACVAGGLLEEATKRLEASIAAQGRRRTPELAVMQQRMARVAESYGDARRQRDWLIAAIETDRNNGDAAADLADLSMKLGDHDTALKALRVVTLLKTPCRMTRAMAFLRQAQIAHQQGDGQKALVFARRARAEDAQLAEAGDFLRQLGDA